MARRLQHIAVPVPGFDAYRPSIDEPYVGVKEWFAHFAALDAPASSAQTRQRLGWTPTHADLIADLDSPAYFGA